VKSLHFTSLIQKSDFFKVTSLQSESEVILNSDLNRFQLLAEETASHSLGLFRAVHVLLGSKKEII